MAINKSIIIQLLILNNSEKIKVCSAHLKVEFIKM